MHNKITMGMSICQAENGFSLDDILKMNLQLPQEVLRYRIFNDNNHLQCCHQHWQL